MPQYIASNCPGTFRALGPAMIAAYNATRRGPLPTRRPEIRGYAVDGAEPLALSHLHLESATQTRAYARLVGYDRNGRRVMRRVCWLPDGSACLA